MNLMHFRYRLDESDESSKELIDKFNLVYSYFDPIKSIKGISESLSKEKKPKIEVSRLIAALTFATQHHLNKSQITLINCTVEKEIEELIETDVVGEECCLLTLIDLFRKHVVARSMDSIENSSTVRPIDLKMGYYATKVSSIYQYIITEDLNRKNQSCCFSDITAFMELLDLSIILKNDNQNDMAEIYGVLSKMMALIKARYNIKPEKYEESARRLLHIIEMKREKQKEL